jgi:hypothetical protein
MSRGGLKGKKSVGWQNLEKMNGSEPCVIKRLEEVW